MRSGSQVISSFRSTSSKRDSIEAGVASAVKQAGRIDILVNNAGIGVRAHERKTVDEFPVEAWDELLSIDLTGVFLVSRTVIPHMKAQGTGGRIINICSVLGLVPMRLQSSYVAAKAGAVNLTRSMALELAPDRIFVNGIAPGSTATEGWAKWIHQAKEAEDAHARLMSHIPLGRPASTQEIAQRCAFPGRAREFLHHRPYPDDRRRLDRRFLARFLTGKPR